MSSLTRTRSRSSTLWGSYSGHFPAHDVTMLPPFFGTESGMDAEAYKDYFHKCLNSEETHLYITGVLGTMDWEPNSEMLDLVEEKSGTKWAEYVRKRYNSEVIQPQLASELDTAHEFLQVIFSYDEDPQVFLNYSKFKITPHCTKEYFADFLWQEGMAHGSGLVKASCCCYGWGPNSTNDRTGESVSPTGIDEDATPWYFHCNGKFWEEDNSDHVLLTPPMSSSDDEDGKCCLCDGNYGRYGNNPAPLSQVVGERCCDTCNAIKVIPARMGMGLRP
jgi:hypothetical protein